MPSFVATGMSDAVFLDPGYFRGSRRMAHADITQAVQAVDGRATFAVVGPDALEATFCFNDYQRRLTFVRGSVWRDEARVARFVHGWAAVLLKGCLIPDVLLPPPTIMSVSPVCFGLEILNLPPYSATVLQAYSVPMAVRNHGPKQVLAFERYTFSNVTREIARRQWEQLLSDAS